MMVKKIQNPKSSTYHFTSNKALFKCKDHQVSHVLGYLQTLGKFGGN